MVDDLCRRFRVGEWVVLADECRIRRGDEERHVRPLVMDLLVCFARDAGQVVDKNELLAAVWHGRIVNESALARAVAGLREVLGDIGHETAYIETVPKRGYRLIASVDRMPDPEGTRLAVLPFRNLSGRREDEFFSEGLADVLIAELGRFADLRVISHQTTLQLRQTVRSVPDIARELAVNAVVNGSVLRLDDRVRVTVALLQPEPERQVWADTYEAELRDILSLQARLARAVAEAVHSALTPGDPQRLSDALQVDPDVHLTYLKARHHWQRWTPDGLRRGLDYLEQAIGADPGYAPAYAGLAHCLTAIGLWGYHPLEHDYSRAKEAATLAVSLDSSLSSGHVALGLVRWLADWDPVAAEEELRRAITLRPSNEFARLAYGFFLVAAHREPAAALQQVRMALELDPLSLTTNFCAGWIQLFAGNPDAAVAQGERTNELHPDTLHGHYVVGWARGARGEWDAAAHAFESAIALSRTIPSLAYLGHASGRVGGADAALRTLDELLTMRATSHVPAISIATVYAGLGDADETFAWLDRSFAERDARLFWLVLMPVLEPVQHDPRYRAFIGRLDRARLPAAPAG